MFEHVVLILFCNAYYIRVTYVYANFMFDMACKAYNVILLAVQVWKWDLLNHVRCGKIHVW